jgi:hypothetical protein
LSLFIELEVILQTFSDIGEFRCFVLIFLFDLERINYDPEAPWGDAQLKEIVLAHDKVYRDEDY